MSKKIRWITETAVMLALLVTLQWVGSFIPEQMTKQLITGTMVNCVLAVTVLLVGLSSGITVALISPVCAFLFGIAPNFITVAPIMAGNCCYVALLHLIAGKARKFGWQQPVALVTAGCLICNFLYPFALLRYLCIAALLVFLWSRRKSIVQMLLGMKV